MGQFQPSSVTPRSLAAGPVGTVGVPLYKTAVWTGLRSDFATEGPTALHPHPHSGLSAVQTLAAPVGVQRCWWERVSKSVPANGDCLCVQCSRHSLITERQLVQKWGSLKSVNGLCRVLFGVALSSCLSQLAVSVSTAVPTGSAAENPRINRQRAVHTFLPIWVDTALSLPRGSLAFTATDTRFGGRVTNNDMRPFVLYFEDVDGAF